MPTQNTFADDGSTGRFILDVSYNKDQTVHLLPFHIESSVEANTQTKFYNEIRNGEDGKLEVEFRGLPFDGVELELPSNCKGYIAKTEAKAMLDATENCETDNGDNVKETTKNDICVVGDFSKFTYWQWDKKPSNDDLPTKVLDWFGLSEILHSEITNDDDDDTDS